MFLDKEIEVSGMPWCTEPKKVGLASLTTKVLCTVHNSALSPVDQEAVRFAEAMRESFRLLSVRYANDRKYWTFIKFPIDGPLMERWFLKTLINAAYDRGSPIGIDSEEIGQPSKTLVEIAFGKRPFKAKAGLFGIFDALERKPQMDGLSIQTFNTQKNQVLGAVFAFLGFRLLLFLDEKGPQLPYMEIGTAAGGISEVIEPTYHPAKIDYFAGKSVSHSITFKWRE